MLDEEDNLIILELQNLEMSGSANLVTQSGKYTKETVQIDAPFKQA